MESKIIKNDMTQKLNTFVRGLRAGYVVKVGILGKKNARNDQSGQSNADIGFIHEFGQPPHIPQRSFIRMPLFQKSERILKEVAQDAALKKLANGKMYEVMVDLGIACERAILDAFDSAGFGTWKKNAPSTIRRKGGSQPLIDLGFLRKSIMSEVIKA